MSFLAMQLAQSNVYRYLPNPTFLCVYNFVGARLPNCVTWYHLHLWFNFNGRALLCGLHPVGLILLDVVLDSLFIATGSKALFRASWDSARNVNHVFVSLVHIRIID